MDGHAYSNTKYLREAKGWTGLLMDCGYEDLSINLHKHHITAENINELFELYNVPYDLDLLVIDIDGNDFYIWKALDEKYRPRLLVIEHNGNYAPPHDVVIPYSPDFRWDHTRYFGANITALYNLGCKKGYSLIYADSSGCNLFFIPNELATLPFINMNNIFRLFRYGGHQPDPQKRPFLNSSQVLD